MTSKPALATMAIILADELQSRKIATNATDCEAIIEAVFRRFANQTNARPMSAEEAEAITKRSI